MINFISIELRPSRPMHQYSRSQRNSMTFQIKSKGHWKASSESNPTWSQLLFLHRCSSFIQGRVQISNELKHRKLGDEATKSQDLIRNAHKVWSFSRYRGALRTGLFTGPCKRDIRPSIGRAPYSRSQSQNRSDCPGYHRRYAHSRRFPQPSTTRCLSQKSCQLPSRVSLRSVCSRFTQCLTDTQVLPKGHG